jgi:hypothetical protein
MANGVDGVDGSALSDLLARAASAAERASAVAADGVPVEGEGSAADGQVVARAVLPGRVSTLTLDPRVLRLPAEEVSVAVVTAVNAALADLATAAGVAGGPADLSGLRDSLERLQGDAQRQFGALTDALLAAQDRLVARADG